MRKYFNQIIGILTLAILMTSCQNDNLSTNGYIVKHYVQNEGPKPEVGDWVYFHLERRVGDRLLSSSRNNISPSKFQLIANDGNVPALAPVLDALELMTVGDSLDVIVNNSQLPTPYDQAEVDDDIIFTFELLEVYTPEEHEAKVKKDLNDRELARAKVRQALPGAKQWAEQALVQYNDKRLKNLQKTDSGIEYVIIKEGKGHKTELNKRVGVHYYAMKKSDGVMFDNSYKRSMAYNFVLGNDNVIQGWHEGIALLREGDTAVLFIPHELAYGAAGNPRADIGEKEDLVFLIEVEKVYY